MIKHTPGPWRTTDKLRIRDAGGTHVATCADHFDMSGKANANLIAAAPDLLSALEAAVADYDQIVCAPDEMDLDWVDIARAAIAKARAK